MDKPSYIVGIDLGTTNSVVAYTEAEVEETGFPEIHVFKIPQLVGPGSIAERPVLPSFLLVPGPHDLPPGALALPWDPDGDLAVGEFARDRGAELPHRLIASSKSWLCHTGVDRRAPILPWEGPEDVRKLSPVAASAAILSHIREAWNHAFAKEDANLFLENQEVFLTVPASFDAVARDLTVEAAGLAGLPQIVLLEEPQAAFYAWIEASRDGWRKRVRKGDLVLVVDVGGGTTDFSLIRVSDDRGELELDRIAVGEHLLVGGDNMDLTLAHAVSRSLAEQGRKLNAYQLRGLWSACRSAKEKLLTGGGEDKVPVTVLGRGSSLIGGTLTTQLEREEVNRILVEGFFGLCGREAEPQSTVRTGMRELGLSYAADPAVTHHLAAFLRRAGRSREGVDGEGPLPTAVLFNGGVMKATGLRRRILEVLRSWGPSPDGVRELSSQDLNLAVAKGAAYYGLARRGRGIRIRGGLGRSYYIGVEAALPAVPGMPTPQKALCLAPFGMEEGTEVTLEGKTFGLLVGEPVRFDFLGSLTRRQDTPGTIVEDWEGEIETLTTLETVLEGEPGTVVPVVLQVKVTEVGALEVWCLAQEGGGRFRLAFNVREHADRENGR
ncbi:DnaK-like protein [uncultured Desulfatiglans sp.]|uniref:DnaK-like protein n=1 Tax=Uncultured Desulfatiglans sp. TaxID=1748965 RepID=A0A653AHY8_UNCDX|nr:DnaK-like protein [uncultured Desulfatiglans sp.]